MPWPNNRATDAEAKAAQLETDLTAAKAEVERLKGLETELTTTKSAQAQQATELAEVKASLQTLQNTRREAPKPETPPVNEPTSFLDDENKAFNERAQPLYNATMENAARLAKMQVTQELQSNPRDRFILSKYGAEFDAFVAQLTPVQRTMEDAYRNCFKIVKANHVDEMLDSASRGTDFFTESSGGPPPPAEKKTEKLSAEESAMAKKFGISEADYMKSKSQIQQVGA